MSEGDSRVEQYMQPISEAISRHLRGTDGSTDIYNRAYEAVYKAITDEREWRESADGLHTLNGGLIDDLEIVHEQLNQAKEERDSYQRVGIRTMEQLNQAAEVFIKAIEISEHARTAIAEGRLNYASSDIDLLISVFRNFLLSQEANARCVKCDKEFEHDLYSCWCNDCGEYAEKEVREGGRNPNVSNQSE